MLLKARNIDFRAGAPAGLKAARVDLSRGIRKAKQEYTRKITGHFKDSRDSQSLWQGIRTLTDYKLPPQTCDSHTSLLNHFNCFFARFEAQNNTPAQKTSPPPTDDHALRLSPAS
ncbi:hypothetical protein CesoFtcFv8_018063 [Champsocephalus esox]|uniref:Uncharacterized protein n=1 Tax=Champsocephalus esox TaxID=159716 RepID=A0AAN8BFF1_9TELE|nr:hypothetical protein CesoFtcFv8_018063 [Champsocephalus esox]